MLYSRLSGSSTGVLLREIPKECSDKFTLFFRKDRTGLIAFIFVSVEQEGLLVSDVLLLLSPVICQTICDQTGLPSCQCGLYSQ